MNPDDLLAQLELDIEWRSNELDALFRDLTTDETVLMRARRRSVVPMLQAHAEGFVRFALRAYLRHISVQNRMVSDVLDVHVAWLLTKEFNRIRMSSVDDDFVKLRMDDNKDVRRLYTEAKFVEKLDHLVDQTVDLDDSPLDQFDQNLNEHYLLALLFQCGLEFDPHRQYANKLNGLVKRRNEVAHGERSVASLSELSQWRHVIQNLFITLRDSVYAAANGERYLRSPQAA